MSVVAERRMLAQQLAGSRCSTPAELVGWLGAVQAQDAAGARWALGLRLAQQTGEAQIEAALDEGTVLRTHLFRSTWQLVTPADLPWMLELIAPRLIAKAATRDRQLGLEPAAYRKSQSAIDRALRAAGIDLTREELARAIEGAGVSVEGQRLSHLLVRAELERVIVSGARRGKHSTHALFERRVQGGLQLERPAALAELAGRYFRSRGPATLADFSWWSGLSVADARAGLDAVRSTLVADRDAFHAEHPRSKAFPRVQLLPAFDEYLIAYKDRSAMLDPTQVGRLNAGGGMLDPCLVVDGRVVGTWRRELKRSAVCVQHELFESLPAATKRALMEAAQRYAAFVGKTLEL